MFACLFVPPSSGRSDEAGSASGARAGDHGRLLDVARQCAPRIEAHAANLVTLDLEGLERLFGGTEALGERIWQTAIDAGLTSVHVAMAGTRTAAILLAASRRGMTIAPGAAAEALAPLPLRTLAVFAAEAGFQESSRVGRQPRRRRADAPVRGGTQVPGPRSPVPVVPNPESRLPRRSRALRLAQGVVSVSNHAAARLAESGIPNPALLSVFVRWGLRTLGQLAALPAGDLSARIGQTGLLWQRLARGEDACPLVPAVEEDPFEATHELEWPVETLEPLSFVLGRLLEPLCQRLERRDRAAAVLSLRLRLVTREPYARSLQLPAPMRDPKVLRTLLLLDLESHPAPAGIDAVTVVIEPTPGRIIQESLFERALPAPEQMSTLVARLGALMGTRRCGSPRLVDSYRPGAFAMVPFRVPEERNWPEPATPLVLVPGNLPRRSHAPASSAESGTRSPDPGSRIPAVALRRFRLPVPARVLIGDGHPVSVRTERQELSGGRVQAWAGPWRTSGAWWLTAPAGGTAELNRLRGRVGWDRDEWEVALSDGGIYRVFEDRESGRWFVDGIVD